MNDSTNRARPDLSGPQVPDRDPCPLYVTYRLSYRDLVAMMLERGIVVSHATNMLWVLSYVPEVETSTSWAGEN